MQVLFKATIVIRAERCRMELGQRIHVVAGSVSQAESAAGARALERLCQLELGVHRTAVVDRDSAVATVKKPRADLQATRRSWKPPKPVPRRRPPIAATRSSVRGAKGARRSNAC